MMLLCSTKAFILANTVIFFLSQLVETKTEDEVKTAFNECKWRLDIDGLPLSISMKTKDTFVHEAIKYFVIVKCKPMLDQLLTGLKYYNVRKQAVCLFDIVNPHYLQSWQKH